VAFRSAELVINLTGLAAYYCAGISVIDITFCESHDLNAFVSKFVSFHGEPFALCPLCETK
jgi:hypothetical protein